MMLALQEEEERMTRYQEEMLTRVMELHQVTRTPSFIFSMKHQRWFKRQDAITDSTKILVLPFRKKGGRGQTQVFIPFQHLLSKSA